MAERYAIEVESVDGVWVEVHWDADYTMANAVCVMIPTDIQSRVIKISETREVM